MTAAIAALAPVTTPTPEEQWKALAVRFYGEAGGDYDRATSLLTEHVMGNPGLLTSLVRDFVTAQARTAVHRHSATLRTQAKRAPATPAPGYAPTARPVRVMALAQPALRARILYMQFGSGKLIDATWDVVREWAERERAIASGHTKNALFLEGLLTVARGRGPADLTDQEIDTIRVATYGSDQ